MSCTETSVAPTVAGAAAPSISPTVRVSCLTPSDSVSVQVGTNRSTPPLGSEVARMQAASCPGSTRSSAGSSSRQRGMTAGQRGANGHASGRLISDGGLPGIGRSGSRTVVSSRGSEPSRPSVYGILLSWNRTSAVAASTAFPAYMTITRSAIPATTPEVMGDEHQRRAGPVAGGAQRVEHLGLDGHVEGGRRLVRDHHVRVVGHRDRDHDPLPLAAGELVREVVHAARRRSGSRRARAARWPSCAPLPCPRGRGSRWSRPPASRR